MPEARTKVGTKSRKSAPSARMTENGTDDPGTVVAVSESAPDVVDAGTGAASDEAPVAPTRRARSRRVLERSSAEDRASIHKWPIEQVWIEYKRSATEDLRNRLIENYLQIVKYTAERMHARLPGEVDVDDLMQAGLFGLMDAIDAFDLERGVKFETFSANRIRGAIFDELRAMDWVPRLVRARTAKVDRARKSLEMELGRKPTEAELCGRLDVDLAEFKKLEKDSHPTNVHSLNRKCFETDSSRDIREIDVIRDQRQDNPLDLVQKKDLRYLITKGLSRAERLIVILYYYEEMTMKEIGMTLDLSESRVSQMHSSILARLKAQMQHREKDL